MAHDERLGLLTLPSGDEIVPSWRDGRQWILAAAAARRALAAMSAGAGRYAGGADVLADLAGGTIYPPFVALLADAGGEVWAHGSEAGSDIEFAAAEIAAAGLYLVPGLMPDISPAAARGGWGDFAIQAVAAASPPANGLLLGTGVVAGGVFTAFTGEPLAAWPPTPELSASDIANDSGVAGDDVAAALDALAALIGAGGGGGAVDSVFGRTGAVVAATGDYTPAQVGADAAGTAAALLAGHLAAGDPHPQYLLRSESSGALPTASATNGPPASGSLDQYYLDVAGALFHRTATAWRQITAGQGTGLPADAAFEQGVRWPGYQYDRLLPDGTAIGLRWLPDATAEGGWVTRYTVTVPLAKMAYNGEVTIAAADLWRVPAAVDTALFTALYIEGFGATADVAGTPNGSNHLALELSANGEALATLAFDAAGYGVDRHAVVRASSAVAYYLSINGVEVGATDSVLTDVVPVVECRYIVGGDVDEAPEEGGGGGTGGTGGAPGAGAGWCPGSGQATELRAVKRLEAEDEGGTDLAWVNHLNNDASQSLWWEAEFETTGVSNRLVLPLDITVPATATIGGLQVFIKRQNLGVGCPDVETFVRDQAVQLLLDGAPLGTAKTIAADWPTDGHEIAIFGGSGDAWGATILPEYVNEGRLALGIIVSGQPDGLGMGALANVYHVQARAYYDWETPLFTSFLEAGHIWEDEEGYDSGDWMDEDRAESSRKGDAYGYEFEGGEINRLHFDGFDFASLPAGAVVSGIGIELMRAAIIYPAGEVDERWLATTAVGLHVAGVTSGLGLPTGVVWASSGLTDALGADRWFERLVEVSSAEVDNPGPTPQVWEIVYLGSPNNLGSLAESVVTQAGFGFYLNLQGRTDGEFSFGGLATNAYLRRARMRVFYTVPEE